MKIEILFFGMSRDLAGKSSMPLELDHGQDVGTLRDVLKAEFPSFSGMETFSIAVNEAYADNDVILTDNDTVAIIPPVSGG